MLVVLLLVLLIIIMLPLLVLGITGAAFTRLGLSWVAALALILLMLAGSFMNVPLYRVQRDIVRVTPADTDGFSGSAPTQPVWETAVVMNIGGAILPVCIAIYLVHRKFQALGNSFLLQASLTLALVTATAYLSSREIPGAGLRVPVLIPALTALLAGLLLTGGTGTAGAAAALAGGVGGTLLGGNIGHLRGVRDLGIPEVSIGGAGTFGAVFLCCVLPALIAG